MKILKDVIEYWDTKNPSISKKLRLHLEDLPNIRKRLMELEAVVSSRRPMRIPARTSKEMSIEKLKVARFLLEDNMSMRTTYDLLNEEEIVEFNECLSKLSWIRWSVICAVEGFGEE